MGGEEDRARRDSAVERRVLAAQREGGHTDRVCPEWA